MHPDIEYIDLDPNPSTGKRALIVRIEGDEVVASQSSPEGIRRYLADPANRRSLKKKSLPGVPSQSKLVRSFGKSNSHSVVAILDEDGNDLYYIIVTPGGIYYGSYTLANAVSLAASLAVDYDKTPGVDPSP
ncbi:hypothetical protein RMR10_006155 [Agrobacterium rosae]|uniref:hypothetical protein n=1 Tax=Agrobacterium rosae TaxID=1972867 RepID=UPI002A167C68|nr:hypothetical protein [Agrobacterium rosae]MDX8317090.1 hypothetical protein [Agrobacterium rosae]